MTVYYSLFLLLLVNFFKSSLSSNDSLCPSYCKCSIYKGMRHAVCKGKRLPNIDTGVPENVQILDLSNNSISVLETKAFKKLQLTSLYQLNLQQNHIGTIDHHAFEGVTELRILDLSYNHLYGILPDIFEDTPFLRSLYLQGNRLKFSNGPILIIPTLQILDLSHCQLDHLGYESFTKLPALVRLDLTNNLLIKLNVEVLEPLTALRKLGLDRNHWSCDSEGYELEAWLNNLKIEHNATCKKAKQDKQDQFERMVLATNEPEDTNNTDIISDEDLIKIWYESEKNKKSTYIEQSNNKCTRNLTTIDKIGNGFDIFNKIPSFWSLMIGFEIGTVFGGLCVWIIFKLHEPKPAPRPRSYSTIRSIQSWRNRASMIRLRSTTEESTILSTEMETINCPDTPPPPYRDVFDTFLRNMEETSLERRDSDVT
ncbi:hypothetical protein C0J52_11035 [Blattella germanica]|nr:hypothetical protein C0J52_11035 [Blattella germanica]